MIWLWKEIKMEHDPIVAWRMKVAQKRKNSWKYAALALGYFVILFFQLLFCNCINNKEINNDFPLPYHICYNGRPIRSIDHSSISYMIKDKRLAVRGKTHCWYYLTQKLKLYYI